MCAEAVTARKTATRLPGATKMPDITIGTQSGHNHLQGLETLEIGCKVVTKSSGRQLWLVTRSQSAGRLTPA